MEDFSCYDWTEEMEAKNGRWEGGGSQGYEGEMCTGWPGLY